MGAFFGEGAGDAVGDIQLRLYLNAHGEIFDDSSSKSMVLLVAMRQDAITMKNAGEFRQVFANGNFVTKNIYTCYSVLF